VLSQASAKGQKQVTSFVVPAGTYMDLRPGSLEPSASKMDIALEGKGLLCVENEEGTLVYTRGGRFKVNESGVLTDSDGRPLLDTDERPLKPGTDGGELIIEKDGMIRNQLGQVGKMKLVEFDRPDLLKREGSNSMIANPGAVPKVSKDTQVKQGFVEGSNVNGMQEISSMIVASRSFEAYNKVIATYRDLDGKVANELGRDQ
jgi:flagellar basal-body rod protein FlgF